MRPSSRGLLVVSITLLAACTHTYWQERVVEGAHPISFSASVYVALPEPGRYKNQTYPESSMQTGQAIADAFQPYVARVVLGTAPERYARALASARNRGATHLIVSKIEHWEERATEWSGKRDRIIINIRMVDVASGVALDAAEVSAKSRWVTFGGDHPQELLPRAVGDYVSLLFR